MGMGNTTTISEPLTLARLALALRLPAQWLREQAEAGRIPCLRAPGKRGRDKLLFSLSAVRRALTAMAEGREAACAT